MGSYLSRRKMYHSKKYLLDMLVSLFGGRAVEELIFGDEHYNWSINDIERATNIVERSVTKVGMSKEIWT